MWAVRGRPVAAGAGPGRGGDERTPGDEATGVVVLGAFARTWGGRVLATLHGDRPALGDRAGLLLSGDRRQLRPRVEAERGAGGRPINRPSYARRYCCSDVAWSTCAPAAVNLSAASAKACRAAGSPVGSNE